MPQNTPLSRRFLVIRGAVGAIRTELYQGREHLVAPVIGLVEGVIWPVNAPSPELVLAEEFARAPQGWNGRPIFVGHPQSGGDYGSGNTPELLERDSIGVLFNANSVADAIASKQLRFEAWLDVAKCAIVPMAADILQRVRDYAEGRSTEPVEISTGLFAQTEPKSGVFNGKQFNGIWRNIVPDHLAVLPAGTIGACSVDMGCGIRANAVHVLTATGLQMPEEESAVRTLAERLRDIIPFIRKTNETGQSDRDVRVALDEALRAAVPNYFDIEAVYPDGDDNSPLGTAPQVVYSVLPPVGEWQEFRRAYTITDGKAELGTDVQEVRSRRVYELVTAAASSEPSTSAAPSPTSAGTPCGCHQSGEKHMNRAERISALVAKRPALKPEELQNVSDAVLTALEQNAGETTQQPPATTPPPATQPPATTPPATQPSTTTPPPAEQPEQRNNATAPAVSLDSLIAAADPDTRATFNAMKAAAQAKKQTSIASLKASGRCKMTDEKLNAMSQQELDQLLELAGINNAAASTMQTSAVTMFDFSGGGAPRVNASGEGVPAPPSLADAIKANRGQTTPTQQQTTH